VRSSIVLAAVLLATIVGARAADETKYPDWRGSGAGSTLRPAGFVRSDQDVGAGQQAPLTPEYQAIMRPVSPTWRRADSAMIGPIPATRPACPNHERLYADGILITRRPSYPDQQHSRQPRIYTDGRDWPAEIDPSYAGYSIGQWIDTTGTGRYDALEVETRGFKGPVSSTIPACRCTGTTRRSSGADLRRSGRSEHSARRDHRPRPCLDASWSRPRTTAATSGASALPENSCVEQNQQSASARSYMLSADGF